MRSTVSRKSSLNSSRTVLWEVAAPLLRWPLHSPWRLLGTVAACIALMVAVTTCTGLAPVRTRLLPRPRLHRPPPRSPPHPRCHQPTRPQRVRQRALEEVVRGGSDRDRPAAEAERLSYGWPRWLLDLSLVAALTSR